MLNNHTLRTYFCTVHNCADIVTIEKCFIAMVAANAIATILIFAASIIGCMGTCCAKQTVSHILLMCCTLFLEEPFYKKVEAVIERIKSTCKSERVN